MPVLSVSCNPASSGGASVRSISDVSSKIALAIEEALLKVKHRSQSVTQNHFLG